MSSEAKIGVDEPKISREIWWQLFRCAALGVLGVLIPILAWHGFMRPDQEETSVWFQRSGSLVVMFAVWLEYGLSNISPHINLVGQVYAHNERLCKKYGVTLNVFRIFGVVLAIIGTLIWGYGDLCR